MSSNWAIPQMPEKVLERPDYKSRYDALCAEIMALAAKCKEG